MLSYLRLLEELLMKNSTCAKFKITVKPDVKTEPLHKGILFTFSGSQCEEYRTIMPEDRNLPKTEFFPVPIYSPFTYSTVLEIRIHLWWIWIVSLG